MSKLITYCLTFVNRKNKKILYLCAVLFTIVTEFNNKG